MIVICVRDFIGARCVVVGLVICAGGLVGISLVEYSF